VSSSGLKHWFPAFQESLSGLLLALSAHSIAAKEVSILFSTGAGATCEGRNTIERQGNFRTGVAARIFDSCSPGLRILAKWWARQGLNL
jgi:hypothetical protein